VRRVDELDAEIRATSARLTALQRDRELERKREIDTMCRAFDGGMSSRAIAKDMGLSKAHVLATLWRAGRTEKGRAATTRARLAEAGGVPA
jgi:hypothetical protein